MMRLVRARRLWLLTACFQAVHRDAGAAETSLLADFEVYGGTYLNRRDGVEDAVVFAEMLLAGTWKSPTTPWSLHGKTRLQTDSSDYTEGAALLVDDGYRRPCVSLDEAYVQYRGDRWEFGAGNQYFADGEGEFYSLTNQINGRDLLDLPRYRSLPSLSLSTFYFGDLGAIRAVVVPAFTPSRLPQPGDRWFPEVQDYATGMPLSFLGRDLPGRNLENLQAGLQLKSSRLVPGGDLSLQVFYGLDTIGVYSIQPLPGALGLLQVFPRYTEWSTTYNIVRGRYAFYGELSYHDTENNEADDDYVENLFGISMDLTGTSPVLLDDLRLFLEYAGESTVTRAGSGGLSGGFMPTGQFVRPLQNSVIIGLRGEQFLHFSLDGGLLYNLDDGDWLFQFGGRYRTRAGIWLGLHMILLDGAKGSFLSRWRDNDRLFLSIQYNH
jgi:hypothetical protein